MKKEYKFPPKIAQNLRLVDINSWFLLVALRVPSGIWVFFGFDKETNEIF